ncbi:hypothetical protein GE09DRAFT_79936 [Coniochaeta sp. 2T2.1]|nr:hypothetical protein GE09DRAFT_79936 [Coniochaeta sp. 2T2.1]
MEYLYGASKSNNDGPDMLASVYVTEHGVRGEKHISLPYTTTGGREGNTCSPKQNNMTQLEEKTGINRMDGKHQFRRGGKRRGVPWVKGWIWLFCSRLIFLLFAIRTQTVWRTADAGFPYHLHLGLSELPFTSGLLYCFGFIPDIGAGIMSSSMPYSIPPFCDDKQRSFGFGTSVFISRDGFSRHQQAKQAGILGESRGVKVSAIRAGRWRHLHSSVITFIPILVIFPSFFSFNSHFSGETIWVWGVNGCCGLRAVYITDGGFDLFPWIGLGWSGTGRQSFDSGLDYVIYGSATFRRVYRA